MVEQTRKITLYFFLFALFIFLAFIIGTRIYTIFTESKSESQATTKSILDCTLSFHVKNMHYDGNILSFDLDTSDEKLLRNLTILVKGNPTNIELGKFVLYAQKVKVENLAIEDEFFVYPMSCEDYNKKKCFVSTGMCQNVKK